MQSGHLGGLADLAFHPSLELHHSLGSLESLAIQGDLEDPEYPALQRVLGSLFGQELPALVGLCHLGNRGHPAVLARPLAHEDQVLQDFHLIPVPLAGFSLEDQPHLLDLEAQEGLQSHLDLPEEDKVGFLLHCSGLWGELWRQFPLL